MAIYPRSLEGDQGTRVVQRALGRVLQERVPVPTSQRRRTTTGRTRTQQGLSRPSQYEPRHTNCRVCDGSQKVVETRRHSTGWRAEEFFCENHCV